MFSLNPYFGSLIPVLKEMVVSCGLGIATGANYDRPKPFANSYL